MRGFHNISAGQVSVWQLEFMSTLTELISQGLADLGTIPEVIFSLRWTISGHFSHVLNTNIFFFFFFLTLEWAQLLVSVLYWMATISSSWSQGHLNSCPLAGIHIFPANALTNRSCFSLLKGLHLLHRAQPAKSGFSKVWTCQQEPSLSDKTPFFWFTWLFSSKSAVLVSLFISAPNQLEHSKSKSVLLGCEWVAQAGQ